MTDEELKNKCTERAKIFQQAMESCKSLSPIDCIEWFADRIVELEKENAGLKEKFLTVKKDDVRKAKLNDCKTYEEKVEYLRQVTNYALFNDDISVMLWCFCQRGEIDTDQLTKAKKLLKKVVTDFHNMDCVTVHIDKTIAEAEQFLSEVEK